MVLWTHDRTGMLLLCWRCTLTTEALINANCKMSQLYTLWCVIRTTALVTSESKQKPFLFSNEKRYMFLYFSFCTCKVIMVKKSIFQTIFSNYSVPPPKALNTKLHLDGVTLLCLWPGCYRLHFLIIYVVTMWPRLFAGRTNQAANTSFVRLNIAGQSVCVHFADRVWICLPLIFHLVLFCFEHSQLQEPHLNSAHFDFAFVLMWWNISGCNLTRWKWTKLDT